MYSREDCRFKGGHDGAGPYAGVIQDAQGTPSFGDPENWCSIVKSSAASSCTDAAGPERVNDRIILRLRRGEG